ncbi:MAG: hypothetical protein AB8B91_13950 [Rubripirellula sp.]
MQTILGGAAQILALRDRRLARTLLEPAFQDRGWLFMGRQLSLTRNPTLNALAGVDPVWCSEVIAELCESDFKFDPADQLEVRSGAVNSLIEISQSFRQSRPTVP